MVTAAACFSTIAVRASYEPLPYDTIGVEYLLSVTPQLERSAPFARAPRYRAYHVKGTGYEGFVIPSEVKETLAIPGPALLLVPLETTGTGGMFVTLVYAESGDWHYAGYIASPNGHLKLWPEGRYLQALTPVYKPSDANCCPSARRLTRYNVRDMKVVAVDSTEIPRGLDLPPWLYLAPGTRAFLGTDGEDAPVAMVCSSVMPRDKRSFERCPVPRRMGTPIIIEDVASGGYPCDHDAQVHVRAANGSWSGYVSVDAVQPGVPRGTLLKVERFAENPQPFGTQRAMYRDPGIMLDATVRVDDFDPKAPDRFRDTRVTVTNGAHAGTNGWVLLFYTLLETVPVPPVMVCPNDLRWLTLR